MMEEISRIRKEERESIQSFLTIADWRKRITAVFVMLASPSDAMKREQGLLPVQDASGSIMNKETLNQIRTVNQRCIKQLHNDFHIFPIDTSSGETKGNQKRTTEIVAETILSLVEGHVNENILCCPKDLVTSLFPDRCYIGNADVSALTKVFLGPNAVFRPRNEVEEDASVVQALPIVIVRNVDGDVLRLRRREKTINNPLHDKIVIWAGGHVRCEDADNGDPLVHCAIRELEEELRLQVERSSLRLIGATYFNNGERTSKHVGIIYEWRSKTNDVAAVLSRSEFFERRGTSLSGSFAKIEQLAEDVEKRKLKEPWSVEIVRNYLANDTIEDLFT